MKKMEEYYSSISPKTKIITSFLLVIVICTAIAVMATYGYQANNDRISDIQLSRIASCEDTYNAFPKVFAPFFPKGNLTDRQMKQLNKLNDVVIDLVEGCKDQVNPINAGGK